MATQFVYYPVVEYPVIGDEDTTIYQMNITQRADILESYKNDSRYYFEYDVSDGDTPEILADKLYDNAEYAWIILQFNNIVNPFEEWCKSSAELNEYILAKYSDPYETAYHLHLELGILVDGSLYPKNKLLSVTNMEYEEIVNEKKRKIKLPLPEVVNLISSKIKDLL